MGTRSLTVMQNEEGKEICVLYRQYDGYPTGQGKDLAEFLKNKQIVNGFTDTTCADIANGMENLAVQLIAYLANECVEWSRRPCVGQYYLFPADTRGCDEEYIYTVYLDRVKNPAGGVCIKVQEAMIERVPGTRDEWRNVVGATLVDGAPTELLNYANALVAASK